MTRENVNQEKTAYKTARIALYLGIGSVGSLLLSILVGVLIPSLGIINLFRVIVLPLSVAAAGCGIMARRSIAAEGGTGWKAATTGLIMGAAVLATGVVTIIIVAIVFSSIFVALQG